MDAEDRDRVLFDRTADLRRGEAMGRLDVGGDLRGIRGLRSSDAAFRAGTAGQTTAGAIAVLRDRHGALPLPGTAARPSCCWADGHGRLSDGVDLYRADPSRHPARD